MPAVRVRLNGEMGSIETAYLSKQGYQAPTRRGETRGFETGLAGHFESAVGTVGSSPRLARGIGRDQVGAQFRRAGSLGNGET